MSVANDNVCWLIWEDLTASLEFPFVWKTPSFLKVHIYIVSRCPAPPKKTRIKSGSLFTPPWTLEPSISSNVNTVYKAWYLSLMQICESKFTQVMGGKFLPPPLALIKKPHTPNIHLILTETLLKRGFTNPCHTHAVWIYLKVNRSFMKTKVHGGWQQTSNRKQFHTRNTISWRCSLIKFPEGGS